MTAFSKCCETYFLLKTRNFKSMRMILMGVPGIIPNKTIVGIFELFLTPIICKIELLHIVNKHIFSDILNSCQISTFIMALCGEKILWCSMSHNFCSSCSSFAICCCSIMITLNPKMKMAFCSDHAIIYRLVFIEFFQVCNVALYWTATDDSDQINQISYANNQSNCKHF